MSISEYFENTKGTGVLATADSEGKVDAAIYARPHVMEDGKWGETTMGAWCFFNNDPHFEQTMGRLYNWFAVDDPRGLAPDGWTIPTDEQFRILEAFLGVDKGNLKRTGWRGTAEGGALKDSRTDSWKTNKQNPQETSGFAALPGGYRDVDGSFHVLGTAGYWWTASLAEDFFAWYRSLYYTSDRIHRSHSYVGDGFSVRCIKQDVLTEAGAPGQARN